MRTTSLGVAAVVAAAAITTGCGTGGSASPRTSSAPEAAAATGESTRLLTFAHRPAARGEQATTVSLWFTSDAKGALVAMRSRRVATKTGRLLQETSFRAGAAAYSIVDHEACEADDDVQPPTSATADGVIADSIGPLDAQRPVAELNDGQVVMRITQPDDALSSRVVTLLDAATGDPFATIDSITLTAANAAAAQVPPQPLRCTPAPKPAASATP